MCRRRAPSPFEASAEDIALAQKILSDLDKTKKIYRLTYTMTERDGGKTIGVQHFSIIVASGSRTDFKQGSRVPIAVATNASSGGSNAEVTYIDVGQEIEANLWTVISMGCDCAPGSCNPALRKTSPL